MFDCSHVRSRMIHLVAVPGHEYLVTAQMHQVTSTILYTSDTNYQSTLSWLGLCSACFQAALRSSDDLGDALTSCDSAGCSDRPPGMRDSSAQQHLRVQGTASNHSMDTIYARLVVSRQQRLSRACRVPLASLFAFPPFLGRRSVSGCIYFKGFCPPPIPILKDGCIAQGDSVQ